MVAFEEELNSNIKAAWDWLVSERRWGELVDSFALGLFHIGTILERVNDMIPWLREARLKLAAGAEMDEPLAFAIISTLEVYSEESEYIKDHNPLERVASTWQFVMKHQLAEPMGFWFVLLAGLVHARNIDPGAEAEFEKAIARLRNENNPWKLGVALLIQSNRWGMYTFDEAALVEAAQIFKNLGVYYEQGVVAELMGSHATQQKQPVPVILEHLQQAKQFYNKLGDESRGIYNFLTLTGLYFREGMIEQGFAVHHETQRALERVGNTRILAINMHWESLRAVRYSTYEHALETQYRSLELIKKHNSLSDFYWGLFELGDIYRVFGQPQKAMLLYEEAYTGFKQLNMTLAFGYYERAYGDIAFEEARYSDALARYEQFVRYATQDNHDWSMAQASAKRAQAIACLEKREQARLELHKVLTRTRDWGEDELSLIALLVEPICLIAGGQIRASYRAGCLYPQPSGFLE